MSSKSQVDQNQEEEKGIIEKVIRIKLEEEDSIPNHFTFSIFNFSN